MLFLGWYETSRQYCQITTPKVLLIVFLALFWCFINMKIKTLLFSLFVLCTLNLTAQNPNSDSAVIRRFFDEALLRGKSHSLLGELCTKAPHRLSGSENAQRAVEWAQNTMQNLGFDTVFLQPCMVPHWVRGEAEEAKIISKKNRKKESKYLCIGR